METKYSLVLDLNGFHLGETRTIEWHSSLEDAAESGTIKLTSPDESAHWITFDIAGGYSYQELSPTSQELDIDCVVVESSGLFLMKDSAWIQKLRDLPEEIWEDWQDRNRILPRSDIRHLVIRADRFQIDLLVTQASIDGRNIPLTSN